MLVSSIIIGYYLSMTILLRENKTNNLNKLYQSLLMGLWMALIELVMIGVFMFWSPFFTILLVILVLAIAALSTMIYYQVGINENQFMLSMQEHHSMGIEMAKLAKDKLTDSRLVKLADNIIVSQKKEIDQMQEILDERHIPDNLSSLLY